VIIALFRIMESNQELVQIQRGVPVTMPPTTPPPAPAPSE